MLFLYEPADPDSVTWAKADVVRRHGPLATNFVPLSVAVAENLTKTMFKFGPCRRTATRYDRSGRVCREEAAIGKI
jgi:hypothetical protein